MKREHALMSANLERRNIGEQFKLVDSARLPETPISPNRRLIAGEGAGAGFLLGVDDDAGRTQRLVPAAQESAGAIMIRFGWTSWMLTATVVGAAAGLVTAARTPHRYRSEALILVVPPACAGDLRPIERDHAAERPSSDPSARLILSRTRLERMIQEFDLYAEERRHALMEVVVEQHAERRRHHASERRLVPGGLRRRPSRERS